MIDRGLELDNAVRLGVVMLGLTEPARVCCFMVVAEV
jgi:hypothetical protein